MNQNNMCQTEDMKFILKYYREIGAWNYYDNLLHFGCGEGVFTNYFILYSMPMEVTKVVGMDFNMNHMVMAQQRYTHPKISFKTIDKNNLQTNERYDRIYSMYNIDDSLHQRNIFEKFYKNFLTPYGDIVILLLTGHFFDKVMDELEDKTACSKVDLCMFRDKDNLTRHLKDIGFKHIICKSFDRYQIFPREKVMIDELKALNFEATDDFVNDFMSTKAAKEQIKYFGKRKNILAVPYQMTFVYAKKLITVKRP